MLFRSSHAATLAASTAAAIAIFACTVNAPVTAPITIHASSDEIRSCRETCDSQASSKCFDSAGLSSCNAACDRASSAGVSTFMSCVKAATCNLKCDDDLRTSGSAGEVDAGPALDGASHPSDDGSIPTGKDGGGADASEGTDGASSVDAADASAPELAECKAACNSPLALSCYEGSTMKDQCESGCGFVDVSTRTTFVSCVSAATNCSAFMTCYSRIAG